MSTIESQYLPLLEVGEVVIFPIVTVMVMCIVYGFYIALFALYIYVIRQGRRLYISWIVTLFIVATGMVAAQTAWALHESSVEFMSATTRDSLPLYNYLGHDTTKIISEAFTLILPIVANIAADFVLIHRCYIIWGYKKRILLPLVFASFAVNVVSITGAIMSIVGTRNRRIESNNALYEEGTTIQAVGLILSAAFNSALTLLTAGRLWWVTRRAESSRLIIMNKIILESGILYPLVMIVHLGVANASDDYQIPLDALPLVALAAGISPTLIIVRIHLGISISGSDTLTKSLRSIAFTSVQPTERSSQLSAGLVENHIKSLPKALPRFRPRRASMTV